LLFNCGHQKIKLCTIYPTLPIYTASRRIDTNTHNFYYIYGVHGAIHKFYRILYMDSSLCNFPFIEFKIEFPSTSAQTQGTGDMHRALSLRLLYIEQTSRLHNFFNSLHFMQNNYTLQQDCSNQKSQRGVIIHSIMLYKTVSV
jgi:hypothetical protein